MSHLAEKYRIQRKKYLASLSPEEREELERKKQQAESESKKRWGEIRKWFDEEYKVNEHHEKAVEILKKAIQSAIDDQAMTLEVKKIADLFILLFEERMLFNYEGDDFFSPIVKIGKEEGRVEIPREGGLARAKNDIRTLALEKIKEEAIGKYNKFKIRGYRKQFIDEMLDKYPQLSDSKAIERRLVKLTKEGLIPNI